MGKVMQGQHQDFYDKEHFIQQEDTLLYRIMLPVNFDESKQYPVVLFLHGAGERGNDNVTQLVHGSKMFASKINRGAFPAIVIFPQCPKAAYWADIKADRTSRPVKFEFPLDTPPTKPMQLVIALMDDMIRRPYIDKSKIYVGGLSMGGIGTFEIVYRKPELFAAAFTICGGGNPEASQTYAQTTPFWVFHGAKDDVVSPQLSIRMVAAMLKNGGAPNFTLYADDNHNSWDSAFSESTLLPWLFSNTKTFKNE